MFRFIKSLSSHRRRGFHPQGKSPLWLRLHFEEDYKFCLHKNCNKIYVDSLNCTIIRYLPQSPSSTCFNDITQTNLSCFADFKGSKLDLGKECGYKRLNAVKTRIMGGVNADLAEFPWLARVFYRNKDPSMIQIFYLVYLV